MTRLIVDLECDGFLHECTKIHCIAITDVDSDYSELFVHDGNGRIGQALDLLQQPNTTIIGHNLFMFDNQVFKKLYDVDLTQINKCEDTFVMSQVLFANLEHLDYDHFHIFKPHIGSHSLAAWGKRLKHDKMEYMGGFFTYTEEMGKYCLQDTQVTKKLYLFLESQIPERTWK